MTHYYYVDTQRRYHDSHIVHISGCKYLPRHDNRLFLGSFYTASDAIKQARKYYPAAFGCSDCCPLPVKKVVRRKAKLAPLSTPFN